jgi:hypothetical protein
VDVQQDAAIALHDEGVLRPDRHSTYSAAGCGVESRLFAGRLLSPGDVVEQPRHRIGKFRTASRCQECANFADLPALVDGRQQLTGFQTPDEVRNRYGVRVERQTIALLQVWPGCRDLQVRQHTEYRLPSMGASW